jgi:hypothetical protein
MRCRRTVSVRLVLERAKRDASPTYSAPPLRRWLTEAKIKVQRPSFFTLVTSTNIVGSVQLLRAHCDLRASLLSPSNSSDKVILDSSIGAALEIREESSHGGHGGHGGCLKSVIKSVVWCRALGSLSPGLAG